MTKVRVEPCPEGEIGRRHDVTVRGRDRDLTPGVGSRGEDMRNAIVCIRGANSAETRVEFPSDNARSRVRQLTEGLLSGRSPLTVAIDVSGLSVITVAAVVGGLVEASWSGLTIVDFYDTCALDDISEVRPDGPAHVGPLGVHFTGWSRHFDRPTGAIVGPCVNRDDPAGIVDYLRVTDVWRFSTRAMVQAPAADQRWLSFRSDQPFQTFVALESLVERLIETNDLILVPLGSGMFATCCLALALIQPGIAVWGAVDSHRCCSEVTASERPSGGLRLVLGI